MLKNFFNREMPMENERKIIEEEVYMREPERSSVNICDMQREKYMKELHRARSKRENRLKKAEMEAKKKAIEK